VFAGGCGTVQYIPEEYEITQERIPGFDLNGDVSITNAQTDTSKQIFFDGTMDWAGDYKTVTDHLVMQLDKEIKNHATRVNSGNPKTLSVTVESLEAIQHPFHFTSIMRAKVQLGNGEDAMINVSQGSPGNMWRVLNGTIALGVIDILKNSKVTKYLSE
jgi:hypothetical protein